MKILFLGKYDDERCAEAADLVKQLWPAATIVLRNREETLTEQELWWSGDYIISYLSPWIVPEGLLNRARVAAINFHPGPPEYPGIGCTNFAIYNRETSFGVTCHYMAAKVDTGKIIAVKRFPLYATDTVLSLTQRCYAFVQVLFESVVAAIAGGNDLPVCGENWTRQPYTRKELDALCLITPVMSQEEVVRRVRAVTFPGAPGACIKVAGYTFTLSQRDVS